MRSALRAFEQLLFPAECLLCQGLLPFVHSDRLLCPVCRHRLRPVVQPWCERCGLPGPTFGPCRACATWPAVLRSARSAVWLDDHARRVVHAFKYRGASRLAGELAEVMARLLPPPHAAAVLLPIPMAPRRLRARGYNQSERLATALAALWGRPVGLGLLRRIRETRSQTALTPEAREANVAGAFGVTWGRESHPIGLTTESQPGVQTLDRIYMLVDDVMTTGATLAAAARALERGGAVAVSAITFGRAALPNFS